MDIAFSLAGLVVGVAVGATGVGGGSLMTPILILFYGITPTVAVGTDLIYASISKAFGVSLHAKNRSLDWRIVGWMALGSVPASLMTLVFLHAQTPGKQLDHLIKLTLAIAIILTAAFTLVQDRVLAMIRGSAEADAIERSAWQRPMTLLCGVFIGVLVTISSVGAGAIGMMMLLLLYPKHPPVRLVGSDLAHAVLITAIAGAGHAKLGSINWSMLVSLLIGAIPGIYLGTRIGFRLQPKGLKTAISGLLIVVGGTMLWNLF